MPNPPRPPLFRAAAGMTLTEVLIAVALVALVIGGAAMVMTRINGGAKHLQYRSDVSELRNILRRRVDCGATIAGANCNGSDPVTVIGNNNRRLVGSPPGNVVGKLTVQVTCTSSTLIVDAGVPGANDPQTGKPLSFSVFDLSDGLCAGPATTPTIVIKDVLLQDQGVHNDTGGPLLTEYYGVTGYCPPGYQAIGAAPQCQFPSAVNPDCCGGRTISNFPVVSGTLSGYTGLCDAIWDRVAGIVQNHSLVCFRRARSGRLDND